MDDICEVLTVQDVIDETVRMNSAKGWMTTIIRYPHRIEIYRLSTRTLRLMKHPVVITLHEDK